MYKRKEGKKIQLQYTNLKFIVWGKITAYRYGARVMITDPAAFKAAGAVEAAVVL